MSSLADLQRPPGTPPPAAETGLPLRVERVRTFDTPDFAGMRFLEVEAKTALNRVRGMPFPWSINPYRGCSHACSYCLAGETPILMADGRTKPMAAVRVGDAVFGTVRQGAYRRYVPTPVLDHWSTVRPAYRVTLADGTQLVASADHRFLTRRGWKHVTGAEQGHARRPHLTGNDKLLGFGRLAAPPKHTAEYRRGYLCGMIRGDAHLGRYSYERPGRSRGWVYRFRLALTDVEALARTRHYLADYGVATCSFLFQAASVRRRAVYGIRASSRSDVEAIASLIAWPTSASDKWTKGFLAGMFDAEGGYSRGVLRLHNTDEAIIAKVTESLRRLAFAVAHETTDNGCKVVRVLGGLAEQLRFFCAVDPAITRKRTIDGRAVKSAAPLEVQEVRALGFDMPMFDMSTGTGDFVADGVVSHNCFARPTHAYLNLSPLGDFERTVVVKTNVAEVLRRELARPSWRGEPVAMGTNTDPYQRCEGRYALMPRIVSALAESRTPFSVLTKGTLITRDVALLAVAAATVPVTAALTVGMLDEQVWRQAEPGTPSPRARLQAVRRLNEAGVPTGVMLAPVMPGLNDDEEQLAALVEAAVAAGATHVSPIVLHLRPGVRELFWPWLSAHHPELVQRYERLYRGSQAAKPYRERVTAFVAERRRAAWQRHGRPPPVRRGRAAGAAPSGTAPGSPALLEGEQLSLL